MLYTGEVRFYAYYSSCIFKFILEQIRHVVYPESKQKLLDSATRFIGHTISIGKAVEFTFSKREKSRRFFQPPIP